MNKHRSQEKMLQAMDRILELARISQLNKSSTAIAKEIESIQYLRNYVTTDWPLPGNLKSTIYIGPYAAKNLADWTPKLAHFIMTLDYALKHDGQGIDELLSELVDV
jgi:hypothetical protein